MKSFFCSSQVLAVGDFDLVLDGQSVAVPARHVGGVETGQGFGADDDVLENLVQRVTDVDAAVGVRRAVVQHELGPAGRGLADFLVELLLLPVGHPAVLRVLRLAGFGHGVCGL